MPMRARWIAFAVVAFAGLTAFAPAPFMRADRDRKSGDVLASLQGTWTIVDKHRMGPNGKLLKTFNSQKIQIDKDVWRYVSALVGKGGLAKAKGKAATIGYKLELVQSSRPTEFRVRRTGALEGDYMVGILQVDGDSARIMYRLATTALRAEQATPRGFDPVPEGWYLMTLRRDH